MFACDLFITTEREEAMWMTNPPADTVWSIHPITEAGMKVVKHYYDDQSEQLGHFVPRADTRTMRRIVRYARLPNRDLTVGTYHMDDQAAAINARYLANKAEAKRIEKEAADYFGPRIDAAIVARDKDQIGKLIAHYPDNVARSFVIMRLRDLFPELKEDGVDLSNWHLHGESVD